jgi:chaperone BCS1
MSSVNPDIDLITGCLLSYVRHYIRRYTCTQASTEVLATMFKHIFTRTSQGCDDKSSALRNEHMSSLANAFASSVPSDMLSPAEVQGYLMIHRNGPKGALEKASEWAADD